MTVHRCHMTLTARTSRRTAREGRRRVEPQRPSLRSPLTHPLRPQGDGGIVTQDLTQADADARAASMDAAGFTPTQTLGNINSSTTITGSGGLNVISVNSVNLVKQTLTIAGSASDIFIFQRVGRLHLQREPDGALRWGDGESHPVELPFRGLRELLPAAMMRV